MQPDRLEELISRRLRALPDPEAPPTLWPRVRVAVERRLAQPWYRRAWREWPAAQRAAILVRKQSRLVQGLQGKVGVRNPDFRMRPSVFYQ